MKILFTIIACLAFLHVSGCMVANVDHYNFTPGDVSALRKYMHEDIAQLPRIRYRACLIGNNIYVQKMEAIAYDTEEEDGEIFRYYDGLIIGSKEKDIEEIIPVELLTNQWQYLNQIK
jgi:hypothetical protein